MFRLDLVEDEVGDDVGTCSILNWRSIAVVSTAALAIAASSEL